MTGRGISTAPDAIPRFIGENFSSNLQIADEVQAVATDVGATAAQVALA